MQCITTQHKTCTIQYNARTIHVHYNTIQNAIQNTCTIQIQDKKTQQIFVCRFSASFNRL